MMNTRTIAFLTMDDLGGYATSEHLAVAVLETRGWRVEMVPWRRDADWGRFAAVVIRSPWDYQQAPEAFLATLARIEGAGARLLNPLSIVRWNLDKVYLLELADRGVPVIPTRHGPRLVAGDIERLARELGTRELIVKPTVGAGAKGVFRLAAPFDDEQAQAALRHYAAAPYLAQAFLPAIVTEGEVSVFYFGGRYSHAILKTPKAGDFRVQPQYGSTITAIEPDGGMRRAVEATLQSVPADLLYARVDLARLPDGSWGLMELEVVEPNLYFEMHAQAPRNFADALEAALRR